MSLNQRTQRVNTDQFSMVPRQDVPRSTFTTQHTHKTTGQGGILIPIFIRETLPGDFIKGTMTLFARMNTLLFPLMDHITAETFFFFTPSRLVWDNWVKMMGERSPNPNSSISYTVPRKTSPASGFDVCSVYDYLGLPTVGQVATGETVQVNALPLRAHNLIWNEWFRDENLQDSLTVATDDGPDTAINYSLRRRNKKHDYFTSALPWPLKGGVEATMPLSGNAPITGLGWQALPTSYGTQTVWQTGSPLNGGIAPVTYPNAKELNDGFGPDQLTVQVDANGIPYIYADLSQATGATINALRLAVQTQRLLERDARSGTRYTELLRAHFGVLPEDYRLQRPEYIGGGKSNIQTQAIPQTSGTGASGTTSPLAALGAQATITGQHHFRYAAKEHGYILGYLHFDAELTYQQGMHRLWTRSTRYDFYWPVFAHLGEQAIRNDEIFAQGNASDPQTFGYQERWAEYRYFPSRISGLFRSTSTGNIDEWHSAQHFSTLPELNNAFIVSDPPFARNLAAGTNADNMQFLIDMLYHISETRPLPMRSVPGGMDRF